MIWLSCPEEYVPRERLFADYANVPSPYIFSCIDESIQSAMDRHVARPQLAVDLRRYFQFDAPPEIQAIVHHNAYHNAIGSITTMRHLPSQYCMQRMVLALKSDLSNLQQIEHAHNIVRHVALECLYVWEHVDHFDFLDVARNMCESLRQLYAQRLSECREMNESVCMRILSQFDHLHRDRTMSGERLEEVIRICERAIHNCKSQYHDHPRFVDSAERIIISVQNELHARADQGYRSMYAHFPVQPFPFARRGFPEPFAIDEFNTAGQEIILPILPNKRHNIPPPKIDDFGLPLFSFDSKRPSYHDGKRLTAKQARDQFAESRPVSAHHLDPQRAAVDYPPQWYFDHGLPATSDMNRVRLPPCEYTLATPLARAVRSLYLTADGRKQGAPQDLRWFQRPASKIRADDPTSHGRIEAERQRLETDDEVLHMAHCPLKTEQERHVADPDYSAPGKVSMATQGEPTFAFQRCRARILAALNSNRRMVVFGAVGHDGRRDAARPIEYAAAPGRYMSVDHHGFNPRTDPSEPINILSDIRYGDVHFVAHAGTQTDRADRRVAYDIWTNTHPLVVLLKPMPSLPS